MPRGDRGGTSRGTGVRCVAANCGNTNADGVSMHYFPKDDAIRRQWIDFVRRKRVWTGPTEYSALCSKHFSIDCFSFRYRFEIEHMGRTLKKANLMDGSVPTIQAVAPAPVTSTSMSIQTEQQVENKPATPLQKRHRLEMLSPAEEATFQSSPPKKLRRGFVKRETARIIAAQETVSVEEESDENQSDTEGQDVSLMSDIEVIQPETLSSDFTCQTNLRPHRVSKKCQTKSRKVDAEDSKPKRRLVSTAVQTDPDPKKPVMKDSFQQVRPEYLSKPSKKEDIVNRRSSDSSLDETFSSPMKDDLKDPSYEPPSSPSSAGNVPRENDDFSDLHLERHSKYFVFENNLLELFTVCIKCCAATAGDIVYVNGSMVKVQQKCESCMYTRTWFSQPFVGNKPAGNLMLSAGILFSGSIPSKALRMMKFMKVASISMSTYMNHQRYFLYPSIAHVWYNFQKDYVSDVVQEERAVVLGGDGRSDTPGHSAKFGSYSMLDLDEGLVVDVQLVQSNEVKSSAHMEKEGLMRSVDFFQRRDINIKTIVTDRHVQVVKWIRENMTETTHCFDVWHVAKGLKKKLFALSKEKDCSELTPWIRSLVNHLYWTAATSAGLDKEAVIAKWFSVLNHIINIHEGHSTLFPTCQHGELEGRERQKKWLKPGTKVFEKLDGLITSRMMKRDIPMLSPHHQTSALEGYHSVVNHFAPKMIGFSYHGMLCRLWLAAIHFNENSQREQAVTRDGQQQYRIVYPKYKKGGFTVRKVPVECQYDYVNALMRTTFGLAEVSHMNETGVQLNIEVPPPLCDKFERPDRDDAIQNLLSRFSHCQPSGSQCTPPPH